MYGRLMLSMLHVCVVLFKIFCCEDRVLRENKEDTWQKKSDRQRASLGMPRGYNEWSSTHHLRGLPRCRREYDCLDVAYWCWKIQSGKRDARGRPEWFADCSQGVESTSWGPLPGTQAMHSRWYSFTPDSVLGSQDRFDDSIHFSIATAQIDPRKVDRSWQSCTRSQSWPSRGCLRSFQSPIA